MSEGVLTDSQPRTEAQARALKIAREELDKVGLTDVVVRLARSGSSFDNRFFYVAKSRVNRSETDVRMTIQRDVADLLCQLERPEEAFRQFVIRAGRTSPPCESGDDDKITHDVGTVGDCGAQRGQQQAARGRSDRPRYVET